MRLPVGPHACQHLVLSVLWIVAILMGVCSAVSFSFAIPECHMMLNIFSYIYLLSVFFVGVSV